MIKIYIFKLFYFILGNYRNLTQYNFKLHHINFIDEFENRFIEKRDTELNYYMLPYDSPENRGFPYFSVNKWKLFIDYFNSFDSYIFEEFKKPINTFANFINNNGIDFFFMISTNLIISNLAKKNYRKILPDYSNYSSFVTKLFTESKMKLPEITKKLFLLFSDEKSFDSIMKKKLLDEQNLMDINANQLEILLYSLRFCLQTANSIDQEISQRPFNNYLYTKILSPYCEKTLKSSCIPGNNIIENHYIKNYFLIENHLNKLPSNEGAYVCGCGTYYSMDPDDFPITKRKCAYCGKAIGYDKLPPGFRGEYGFALVPGHFRIFKDLEQKKMSSIIILEMNKVFLINY